MGLQARCRLQPGEATASSCPVLKRHQMLKEGQLTCRIFASLQVKYFQSKAGKGEHSGF
jgi:hypothetical protein